MFASALVRTPEQLPEQLLSRVAHKHVSLGIRAQEYTIVGHHLLKAVGSVRAS